MFPHGIHYIFVHFCIFFKEIQQKIRARQHIRVE